MNVIKRNGSEAVFKKSKIINAVKAANGEADKKNRLTVKEINEIAKSVEAKAENTARALSVEEIQDLVEEAIMSYGKYEVSKKYITYRYQRSLDRKESVFMGRIHSLIDYNNEEVKQENSNKNPRINSVQRDYMAGEISKEMCRKEVYPREIIEAHDAGIIHIHDMDYRAQPMTNCCLVDLDSMLQYGTVISDTLIEKPHSFSTACNIATQIIAQVASSQYGGQSFSLTALAKFVDVSRVAIRKKVIEDFKGTGASSQKIAAVVKRRLMDEINKGVQTLQYQIITLQTTNGQAPFVTMFMYLNEVKHNKKLKADLALLIEEVLKQRIAGIKNAQGHAVSNSFPKLIYVTEEDNITPDSKYWYLTVLAAKCTNKRLVPDYVSEKKMLELKVDKNGEGHCYPPMGCRSFLTPYVNDEGKPQYYGRFNMGVCTINLVDIALSSKGDEKLFWELFDERLEMCHKVHQITINRLKHATSDVAPILWQHGALSRLKSGEEIGTLFENGYATISLGFAGLYECVKYMTGHSHTDEESKPFALYVMNRLNDACKEWKAESHIDYSVYGSPIESTTYKFAKCLQKRFGNEVKCITDKNYITNSYHVPVTEKIDAFTKLKFESEFQELSPGGAISYVEIPNMNDNIEAVLSVIQFIHENIMYAELNSKSDYCQVCGFDGEIEIVTNEHNKLIWKCPKCGNIDREKMNIARRVCGYISTNDFNQGRTQEIKERVLHL